jgi:hypothetical protein
MVEICAQHLISEMRYLLDLDRSERIMHIEKDNWIGYSRAKQAMSKLQNLYLHPQRQRMPNLLIIGPTNNGKSMIIEKFIRDHPIIKNKLEFLRGTRLVETEMLVEIPVIAIQMLPVPDIKRFYRSILEKIISEGGTVDGALFSLVCEKHIVDACKTYKVKMLVIDEVHNILAGRNDRQREFLNALRYLGNALKIPIVCVGIKDAYLAIRSDPQLENRFEPFLLPVWKAGQEYETLLASIASVLPLKYLSNLNHQKIANQILDKSEGILGEVFTLLRRAAVLAIELGDERIDEKILSMIDYHSPTERIRLYERSIADGK